MDALLAAQPKEVDPASVLACVHATITAYAETVGKLAACLVASRHVGVPLLASNDVHYHVPDRRPLQDVLTCVPVPLNGIAPPRPG